MSTTPLPLSLLCNVSVTVSPQGAVIPAFNQALFIGTASHIPSQGSTGRLRQYAVASFPQNIIADGFAPTDPEYICAQLYCSQTPAPQLFWLGRQDLSAIGTATITSGHSGTGYVVNDTFAIAETGGSGGVGQVTAVAGGVPTAFQVLQQGTGYSVGTGYATTALTGAGAGLQVSVLTLGETPLQALTACRTASQTWYTASICGATAVDHLACAAFAQAATPQMQYLYTTGDAAVLNNAPGHIGLVVQAAGYNRAHGTYATTQGGAYPNQPYFSAGLAGVAMGRNTGLANSNFTLANKTIVGVYPEPLTVSQTSAIAGLPGMGTGANLNVYVNFANDYNFYEQGVNGNGSFFDQVLGLDMLAADAQLAVVGVFASNPAIAQTDAGQAMILAAVTGACRRAGIRGFIATGANSQAPVWTGPTILNLTAGTALPTGYLVQSPAASTQSKADRAARKSLPIYVSVILAGSMQSSTIGVLVQI